MNPITRHQSRERSFSRRESSSSGDRSPRWSPRSVGLVALALLPILYSVGVLVVVSGMGDIGLSCVLGTVTKRGIPPGFDWADARPGAGDQVVAIGGRRIDHYPDYVAALRDLRHQIGEQVNVAWRPVEDGPIRRGVATVARRPVQAYVWSGLWFFQEMAIFGVGVLVFWKRPRDESARLFFWLCLVTVGAYMGGYHWTEIVVEPSLIYPFVLFAMALPLVSLHLYLVFPRVNPVFEAHRRATLIGLYGIPALFLVGLWSCMGRISWLRDQTGPAVTDAVLASVWWIKWLSLTYIGLAVVVFGLCIVCLRMSYRAAATRAERNQAYWILLASWLSVLPIGYMLWNIWREPARLGMASAAWPMYGVSLLYTTAYALSISRYKLMQVKEIYNRSKIYVLVSILAGLLFSATLVGTTLLIGDRLLTDHTSRGGVIAGFMVLTVLICYEAIRGRFQRAIDRRFSREKYKFDEAMRRMNLAVGQLVDRGTLGRRLLEAAADTLRLEWGAIYLADAPAGPLSLAAWHGPEPDERTLAATNPLIDRLRAVGTVRAPRAEPQGQGDAQGQHRDPATDTMIALGGEIARLLAADGVPVGLIVLGPKRNGLPYEDEEVAFLGALSSVAMLTLHSAGIQQTLERLNLDLRDKVDKIAEQQRRILILQDQLSARSQAANEGRINRAGPFDPMIFERIRGSGGAVRSMLEVARKVAASTSAVLIRGESGTGKELLAEAIHSASPRADRSFVQVHCAALSQGLLESELFGHVKGAFTGADRDRVGRFEQANGGTLFLDEIGDINLEVQTKLLRVLQEMAFERVGSSQTIKVDVRIVAATHQDLESLIRAGKFREDLFYRLNVIPIETPTLRERREDIFELAVHFLGLHAERIGRSVSHIDDEAVEALVAYDWPGNVRELENVVERAVVLSDGPALTLDDLPLDVRRSTRRRGRSAPSLTYSGATRSSSQPEPARIPSDRALAPGQSRSTSVAVVEAVTERAADLEAESDEKLHLLNALAGAHGNKSEAARLMGLPRSTFFSKLKKHGLTARV